MSGGRGDASSCEVIVNVREGWQGQAMQMLLQQLLQRSIQSSPLELIDPRDHLIGMRECLREFNELDYMANGGVEFTTSLSNTIDRCLLIIHHYPFRIYTHHHSKRKFDIGVEWIFTFLWRIHRLLSSWTCLVVYWSFVNISDSGLWASNWNRIAEGGTRTQLLPIQSTWHFANKPSKALFGHRIKEDARTRGRIGDGQTLKRFWVCGSLNSKRSRS